MIHPKHQKNTAEDNLNIALRDITVTGRDGRVSQLDQVYIRGSMVRFFIVPDMLQNAPMSVFSYPSYRPCHLRSYRFKRTGVNAMRGKGIGTARGRATIMRGVSPPGSPVSLITDGHTLLFLANARRGRGIPPPRGIRR